MSRLSEPLSENKPAKKQTNRSSKTEIQKQKFKKIRPEGHNLPGEFFLFSILFQADRTYSQMAILSSGAMYMLSPSLIPKVSKKLSFCMTLTLTR